MITLPLPPTNNVYYRRGKSFSGQSVTYLSEAGKEYKSTVLAYCMLNKLRNPTHSDFEMSIIIHPRLTKKGVASAIIGDLDAYFKALLDALQGCIYHNDKQVKRISAEYGDPMAGGGITVMIGEYLR